MYITYFNMQKLIKIFQIFKILQSDLRFHHGAFVNSFKCNIYFIPGAYNCAIAYVTNGLQTSAPSTKCESESYAIVSGGAIKIIASAVSTAATAIITDLSSESLGQSSEPSLSLEIPNSENRRSLVYHNRGHRGGRESHETLAGEYISHLKTELPKTIRSLQRPTESSAYHRSRRSNCEAQQRQADNEYKIYEQT